MNTWFHCQPAARKWGGTPNDYLELNTFIDSSKQIIGDVRHRSLYHHTAGVFLCERIFGPTLQVGRKLVPVRLVAEQHILEDLGWLPSPADYLDGMPIKQWMGGKQTKTVSLDTLNLTPGAIA